MEQTGSFTHDCLVCIDSDGCAFNSMESKHRQCFGPAMLTVWPLTARKEQVLKVWNEVNLYSWNRAVNRFNGLALVLRELGEKDWEIIDEWTKRAVALSNKTLESEFHPALRRALQWSLKVNQAIANMPIAQPFEGVKKVIECVSKKADIVVVSSTNPDALRTEWTQGDMIQYTSAIMSHSDGPKETCIAKLLEKGYSPDRVIMLGDAPGDFKAARKNRVHFYPIRPKREKEDWEMFQKKVFPQFAAGGYQSPSEDEYHALFMAALLS